MNLVQLIKAINYLNELVNEDLHIDSTIHKFSEIPQELKPLYTSMESNFTKLLENHKNFKQSSIDLLNQLNFEIQEKSKPLLEVIKVCSGTIEEHNNHSSSRIVPEDFLEQTRIIVSQKCLWNYPTLEIGCGNGAFTNWLVSSEIIYITDLHKEYLENTLNQFNSRMQKRIKPYLIDQKNIYDYKILPQNQIGFIFSWDVFDYYSLPEIKKLLKLSYELLRPGGSIIFTFNDCEFPTNAYMAEKGLYSWMTKSILTKNLELIGFEVIKFYTDNGINHMVEAKKPGTLSTYKFHAIVGKILPKNLYFNKNC